MIDDLRRFLELQGVTPAGIRLVEPKLADWERVLRARRVFAVPDLRVADKWTEAQYQAYVQIMNLYTQESQTQHKRLKIPRKLERMLAQHAHQFRDMSGVRWFEAENEDRPSSEPEPSGD
jgi:hypothetical protein